ncbi:15303_t:CDS:2 [Rhizophagus irregularis]|nr:15303_t:CDS:2 [Rhizophagus irregularis]
MSSSLYYIVHLGQNIRTMNEVLETKIDEAISISNENLTSLKKDAAPTLKRDADAEVKQLHDRHLGRKRDANAEANSFEGDEDEPINEEPVYWNEEPADWQDPFT